MIKEIMFDIDGVLIEADKEIRVEKYKSLFERGLNLVKGSKYSGSSWLFPLLKEMYDNGEYCVDPLHYKLINKDTVEILKELSKKYKLSACSLANVKTSKQKLRATNIIKYFKEIKLKPLPKGNKSIALVDDRDVSKGYYNIKFNYGKHKKSFKEADKTINNINEL